MGRERGRGCLKNQLLHGSGVASGKPLDFQPLGIAIVFQSLSPVQLFVTPWTVARHASLSFTISWSLLKLISIESVMTSNHFVFCHPLLLLPSIFPSIRVFSNESALHIRWPKYWSFSFSLGFPGHSAGKESACNAGDPSSIRGFGRSPGRERLPTPVFWPGEFLGLYSPCSHKELETTEQL